MKSYEKIKKELQCPACEQSIGSPWGWVLPRSSGKCKQCQASFIVSSSTRLRQRFGVVLGSVTLAITLALLLIDQIWLAPAIISIALYYNFNYLSANRVQLELPTEERAES